MGWNFKLPIGGDTELSYQEEKAFLQACKDASILTDEQWEELLNKKSSPFSIASLKIYDDAYRVSCATYKKLIGQFEQLLKSLTAKDIAKETPKFITTRDALIDLVEKQMPDNEAVPYNKKVDGCKESGTYAELGFTKETLTKFLNDISAISFIGLSKTSVLLNKREEYAVFNLMDEVGKVVRALAMKIVKEVYNVGDMQIISGSNIETYVTFRKKTMFSDKVIKLTYSELFKIPYKVLRIYWNFLEDECRHGVFTRRSWSWMRQFTKHVDAVK